MLDMKCNEEMRTSYLLKYILIKLKSKKMKNTSYIIAFTVIIASILNSCKKDDPEIPNEEEVITTLKYTLTPVGGGTEKTLKFVDLDGDGGNAPVYTVDTLDANITYMGTLELLNEQESPADTTTNEIRDENQQHQFFFRTSGGLDLAVAYDDADPDGNPVGIENTLSTGAASSGQLTITLRHQLDKFASGVSDGDITNAGGKTDIEVEFDVVI